MLELLGSGQDTTVDDQWSMVSGWMVVGAWSYRGLVGCREREEARPSRDVPSGQTSLVMDSVSAWATDQGTLSTGFEGSLVHSASAPSYMAMSSKPMRSRTAASNAPA